MSDAPAPTRAEEGREIRPLTRLEVIALYGHLTMPQLVLRMEIAEAEVARLTAALAEAERERDAAISVQEMCAMSGGFYARHSENATNRAEAAEASASALRERVATLETALKPFCFGDAAMEQILFGSTPDSAPCNFTIKYGHVRAARTALEAPYADT